MKQIDNVLSSSKFRRTLKLTCLTKIHNFSYFICINTSLENNHFRTIRTNSRNQCLVFKWGIESTYINLFKA